MTFHHYSVLLRETIEGLAIRADGVYVDGTLGGGGHALSICERLSGRGRLIGIDQDGAAIEAASERLKDYRDRAVIVRGNYEDIAEILMRLQIERVDGICLDLGVSSYQLDEGERGFSYRTDAALDMRMDQRGERTAADIVNSYSEEALFRIIRDYGEDRFARNIAKHIVQYREKKRIETTLELSGIISGAIPARVRALSGHPAKRSFQAIRIELNRELEVLENTLDRMIDLLSEGGRLCVRGLSPSEGKEETRRIADSVSDFGILKGEKLWYRSGKELFFGSYRGDMEKLCEDAAEQFFSEDGSELIYADSEGKLFPQRVGRREERSERISRRPCPITGAWTAFSMRTGRAPFISLRGSGR